MPEILSDSLGSKKRRSAAEAFLGALVKGSKTVSLYKDGHSVIAQVTGRVNQLLRGAVGEEPNLALELKSKSVLLDDEALEETPETIHFAAALHALGIGQVIFTTRLDDAGLLDFMLLLVWKPTEETTLTDKQKTLQTHKIDGLQIISILSFVVTGDQEEDARNPGDLSEEQISAINACGTIPDFLHLILKQAEIVSNKAAEGIVFAIDQVLHRDIPIEQFEEEMAWDCYDGRIKARWEQLRSSLAGRKHWTRAPLISELTTFSREEFSARKDHHSHDAFANFSYALTHVHAILENPVGEQQARFALSAYARLLEDLGRIGDLKALLREFDRWRKMAQHPAWSANLTALREHVQQKVPSPALASGISKRVCEVESEIGEVQILNDFTLTVGAKLMPPLLEEFRAATGKTERQRLTKFLAGLYKLFDPKPLLEALKDPDYFFVIGIIGVLAELAMENLAEHIGFLLDHKHEKVRAAVIGQFRRSGGAVAARELADFIASGEHDDQAQIAATTLSIIPVEGVDDLLIEAYGKNDDYDVRVAIVTALGRHPGPDTADFLREVARQNFKEWVLDMLAKLRGTKTSLRVMARKSLRQIEGHKEVAK